MPLSGARREAEAVSRDGVDPQAQAAASAFGAAAHGAPRLRRVVGMGFRVSISTVRPLMENTASFFPHALLDERSELCLRADMGESMELPGTVLKHHAQVPCSSTSLMMSDEFPGVPGILKIKTQKSNQTNRCLTPVGG